MFAHCDTDIEEIINIVFTTMLNIPLERIEPGSTEMSGSISSLIKFQGDTNGSVLLTMSADLVDEAASSMMRIPRESLTDDDRHETATELANMVGGNVKGLFEGHSTLTLPTIADANDIDELKSHSELVDELWMSSTTGSLCVQFFAVQEPSA